MPARKAFTIRRRVFPTLNGPRWEVDCGLIEGKRLRKFFRSKTEAENFAGEKKESLKAHGERSFALSEDDRIAFQAARDRLAASGATIQGAVEFYLAHHQPVTEALTLRVLVDRAVLDKELAGRRPRYVAQFRNACLSFVRGREEMAVASVTRELVKTWVLGNNWAGKTQKGYLGDLRSLFSWAVQERYLAVNPLAGKPGFIPLSSAEPAEITGLGIDECARLLRTALFGSHGGRTHRELIGYIALAMFAGVRPHEIVRTPVERIDLRERTVLIGAKSAKTRQRRVIELNRVAVVWLRLWQRACPGQASLTPTNFVKRWKALRGSAGFLQWPHDVLRHTFASYHYAAFGNLARLQSQLGHSEDEDTLFRHYRAVQTLAGRTLSRKMAAEFWQLSPRRVRLSRD